MNNKRTRDESDSDSSENDSGEEQEELGPPVACLFCSLKSESIGGSVTHVNSSHGIDIEAFLSKNASTTYDLVKIVTYIRSKKISPSQLQEPGRPWDSEEFLKPVDPEDPWLWTHFDFIDDEDLEPKYVNSENGTITLAKEHFDELQKKNTELKLLIEEKDKQMERLRNLLNEADEPRDDPDPSDDAYFASYSEFNIHREMLQDRPRMEAFRKLFQENKEMFQGKGVLDVGCGTGILSMMAADAGAKEVVGVDESKIVYNAMDIIKENNFDESKIRLVKCKVENAEFDSKFDVIVSEWMGYFLLFEGMLSSVITARDRFLKDGGLVFPSACKIYLAGVSDPSSRDKRLECQFYGYRMDGMRRAALSEPSVEAVPAEAIVTEAAVVHSIDILHAKQEDCYFSSDFLLTPTRDAELTSVCGWFDCSFAPASAALTTSPFSEPTHWLQTNFYLFKTRRLKQGETICGRISVSPSSKSSRSLNVVLVLRNVSGAEEQVEQEFHLS